MSLPIISFIVLIISIILHEVSHGYMAEYLGDPTARLLGRLTLNPIPHIDPVGSILIPGVLILFYSVPTMGMLIPNIILGWAKPVPVSEHNLNPYNLGKFCVSVAGVTVNLLIAIIFTIIGSQLTDANLKELAFAVALLNAGLGIFNLIPFPPADGYRIIENFLPHSLQRQVDNLLQQYFMFTIIGAIILASLIFRVIFPLIYSLIYSAIF